MQENSMYEHEWKLFPRLSIKKSLLKCGFLRYADVALFLLSFVFFTLMILNDFNPFKNPKLGSEMKCLRVKIQKLKPDVTCSCWKQTKTEMILKTKRCTRRFPSLFENAFFDVFFRCFVSKNSSIKSPPRWCFLWVEKIYCSQAFKET